MAVEYNWSYGPMKVETVNGINNVVTGIQWCCIAKDLTYSNTITGVESGMLSTPTVDPDNYITIEELTSTIVQEWINAGINKMEVEAKVLTLLNDQLFPSVTFIEVPTGVNTEPSTLVSPNPDPEVN